MSLKSEKYLKQLAHDLNDEELNKDLLNYYIDTLSKLNETGGYVYRLVFVNSKKEAKKNLMGNAWTLNKENLPTIYNQVDVEDSSYMPFVMTAKVQPGSIDLEDSLEKFTKAPSVEEVVFLNDPPAETVTRFEMSINEQEEADPEAIKRQKFTRNLMDDATLKRYFGSNPLAVAKYILKHDMLELWMQNRVGQFFQWNTWDRNRFFPVDGVTCHLYDIIMRTFPNKFDYVTTNSVGIMSTGYYETLIPAAQDLVKYFKECGIYDYIVEYRIYTSNGAKCPVIMDLGENKKITTAEWAKEIAKDEDFFNLYFDKNSDEFGKYLIEHGLMPYMTSKDMDIDGDVFDAILKYSIEHISGDTTLKLAVSVLSDVEIMDGKVYWILDELKEVAEFFADESLLEEILGDHYHYESYDNGVHDFEGQCIDTLTPEALKEVGEVITNHHGGEVIVTYNDEFMDLALPPDDDDAGEYEEDDYPVRLTPENVQKIIADTSLLNILLAHCDDMDDIKDAMERSYGKSYDQQMADEIVNTVWKEIRDNFGEPENYNTGMKRKVKNDNYESGFYEYEVTKWRIDVTKSFLSDVKEFLGDDYGYSLTYYGSYSGFMKEKQDGKIDVRLPDYVWNSKELESLYNENIVEYLAEDV